MKRMFEYTEASKKGEYYLSSGLLTLQEEIYNPVQTISGYILDKLYHEYFDNELDEEVENIYEEVLGDLEDFYSLGDTRYSFYV